MSAGAVLAWCSAFGVACQGSLSADASANARVKADSEGDAARFDKPVVSKTTAALTPALHVATPGATLLGARSDLTLSSGHGTASCECLTVGLGGAQSSSMQWSSAAPPLADSLQLAIAMSSEGATCKTAKGSRGASYWGYRISGNDVIVMVEAIPDKKDGPPLVQGAVIPKPVGSGQVFVTPAFKKQPYGRPLDGAKLCKIGNPGEPRALPFSNLELGVNEDETSAATEQSSGVSTGAAVPVENP